MNIKISVIIPVYNKAEYITDCLESVCNQTLKDIEIICVNDGSTDNSRDVIKTFQENDNRVILIDKENGGAATARNAALEVAIGEFVVFMDPDDWYPDNDILEVLYSKAKANGVLICGGSFSNYYEKKGVITEYKGRNRKYTFNKEGIVYYKDYQFDYGYHRFIYNLEFLRKNDIKFPLYLRFQDPPFFVKAMILAEKFYAVDKIVYRYRAGYQTINWTERKLTDLLHGLRDNIKMSSENNLSELHAVTLERLGKNYIDMYAEKIYEFSPDFSRALWEIDDLINPTLLSMEPHGEKYIDVIPNIFKRAIEIKTQNELSAECERLKTENKKLKKEIKNIRNSSTFKIGKLFTWLPTKIKKAFRK